MSALRFFRCGCGVCRVVVGFVDAVVVVVVLSVLPSRASIRRHHPCKNKVEGEEGGVARNKRNQSKEMSGCGLQAPCAAQHVR